MSVGWRKWTGREAASGCRGTRAQRQAPHPGSVSSSALATSSSFLRQDKGLPVFFFPGFLLRQALWGGCGSCIAPSGPYLPWTLSTLSPCRPFSCTFLFLRGGDPVWLRAVSC